MSVVTTLFHALQARDWDAAAGCLAPDVEVTHTETRECFRGAAFLAVQRDYPDGWELAVHRVVDGGDRVAAEVSVDQDGLRHWCAGSDELRDGLISRGREH